MGMKGFKGFTKDRRRGSDRRKHVDPRYGDGAYPEFVDRRGGDRRKPVYEDVPALIREHPVRKWVLLIGVVIAALVLYLFLFSSILLNKKCKDEKVPKRTITIGRYQDGVVNGHEGTA